MLSAILSSKLGHPPRLFTSRDLLGKVVRQLCYI